LIATYFWGLAVEGEFSRVCPDSYVRVSVSSTSELTCYIANKRGMF